MILALILFASSMVVCTIAGLGIGEYRKYQRRRVPIRGSGYGRWCPVCHADPEHLCTEAGVTLLWQVHARRASRDKRSTPPTRSTNGSPPPRH
jgi:hypothetical protein